jgi:hypothetical protein
VKRLIVIMISVIFLSAFIMMNYLLWDKDNLVKQQEQDKIQQDWLLGQNRALEQSIQDQDSINKKLTTEISELKFQITQFESQLRSSKDQNDLTSQLLTEKNQVVEVYKSDSLDKLRGITENWLLAINEGRLDDSFLLFGTQAVFMGRLLNLESYKEYFTTNVGNIILALPDPVKDKDGKEITQNPVFERVSDEWDDLTIEIRTQFKVTFKPDLVKIDDLMKDGVNNVRIKFKYNEANKKWDIIYINAENP